MATVYLSPDIARPAYLALQDDPRRSRVLAKVDEVLDALEDDHRQRWLRSIRFQSPPLWCVRLDAAGEPWVVLWSVDPEDPDPEDPVRILVDYIGPADFR